MADTTRMGLTYILSVFYISNFVTAFNIDIKNPHIYSTGKNTYFGYSLAFNGGERSVIVGAPLSNDTNKGNKNWGSVFKCEYIGDSDTDAVVSKKRKCGKLENVDTIPFGNEEKQGQMMGATIYSDNYRTMACAPRYKTRSRDANKYQWLQGKCDIIYPKFDEDENWVWKPCVGLTARLKELGYCEAGFSVKFYGEGNDVGLLTGMPRAQLSKGLLTIREDGSNKFTAEEKLNISDYLGYAVASGRFSGKDSYSIVGGAPRANFLTGMVLVYKVTNAKFPIMYSITDPKAKPGSYFGSSLAAADINNDNFDDLIVGAPYYSSGTAPNEGAVHVYLNKGVGKGGGVRLAQSIYGDKEGNACFGYSIGSVGDLNRDANSDIVVGAPWGGPGGKGVVYVYYGQSSDHKPLIFKQKLTPEGIGASHLNGFGYSFAEYYPYKTQWDASPDMIHNDIDDNKYPDLAIGAYRSDSVTILRSRPVVTIIGTFDLQGTKKIDLYDPKNIETAPDGKKYKFMKIKVSFVLSGFSIGKEGTSVQYTLDVDSDQKVSKRGFFMTGKKSEKKNTLTDVLNVKNVKKSQVYTVYLVNNTKDVVRELVTSLSWDIKEDSSCKTKKKVCVVANQMLNTRTIKKIPYIKGCSSDGNDECNTDLKISITKTLQSGGNTIQNAITKLVDIHVKIENNRENAFLNKLLLVYPSQIQPNKVQIENYPGTVIWDPNASLNEDKNTLLVQLSNPIRRNTVEKVNIQFGVSTIKTGTKKIFLYGNVTTESKEMRPVDNEAQISIDVALVANLTVTGNVVPEQIRWKKDTTDPVARGTTIKHTFLFQNRGPSSVDNSDVVVRLPEKVDNKFILNIVSVVWEGSSKFDTNVYEYCDIGKTNPVGLNDTSGIGPRKKSGLVLTARSTNNGTKPRRVRRDADETVRCGGKGVSCRTIKCKLSPLLKNDYAVMSIYSTLVEATFETHIKDNRKINVYAKFTSKAVDKPAKDAAKDDIEVPLTVISPHVTVKGESKPLPWWVILLCVLAALIIICGVVAILYKKKFFERNRAVKAEEADKLNNGDPDDDDE